MGTKYGAEGKVSTKKRGKKVKKRNKVERRASFVSTPVRSQRNAALKSLRRSQRSQKKRRGLLSRLFSRNREAAPPIATHDTEDTNTTGLDTPDVTGQMVQTEVTEQVGDGQPAMMDTSEPQVEQPRQPPPSSSSSSSNSSRGSAVRKPRPRISFSSARTRRPRDIHNWLQWRSELNQYLSKHILSGNKVDMDDLAIRAVSESVDKDALKAILKAAYAKDHTTLDQVAYLVFGVPRIHDKENVHVQQVQEQVPPSSPRGRFGLDSKARRSVLDAVYAQSQQLQSLEAKSSAATPRDHNSDDTSIPPSIKDRNISGLPPRPPIKHMEHSKGYDQPQTHQQRGPPPFDNTPLYATPMKPVAGMYKNYCNRPNQGDYGIPRKTNRASLSKYGVSPACKASPRRSQNAAPENGNVRRSKKLVKDPNRCPTIDENFTMEYYHEANKIALERQGTQYEKYDQYDNNKGEALEDPEIDYETDEDEEEAGSDEKGTIAPPMLAEPMDAPRRRRHRSKKGTPKGWAPSMAEILRARSVLSPIASPGNSPPGSPIRQRQILSKYGPPIVNRGRLSTPQGSAPVSRQTSNASSSVTLPGQRPHPLGYQAGPRCDSNLSSLADSLIHAGARHRLSDQSSTVYSPTPPLQQYCYYHNDFGGPGYRRQGPPVAPKPRNSARLPVPCPPPPPPVQPFQEPSSNFHRPFHYQSTPGLPSDLMRAIQLNRKPSNLSSIGPSYAS